ARDRRRLPSVDRDLLPGPGLGLLGSLRFDQRRRRALSAVPAALLDEAAIARADGRLDFGNSHLRFDPRGRRDAPRPPLEPGMGKRESEIEKKAPPSVRFPVSDSRFSN